MPPAASDARKSSTIRATSASLAVAVGALAHRDPPERRVPHQEPGVEREPAVEAREVLVEAVDGPRHAARQARSGIPSTRASIRIR